MAAFPNLAEHLYQAIGVICGRYLRAGEALPNPGVLSKKQSPKAEAVSPTRAFEQAPRSRVRGAVRLMGESATPTLAEDILTPGKGRIRGLLISGANPASAIPDSHKVVEAFRALDLLVVIEPFESETARLADYVLPPRILYEHADLTFGLEMSNLEMPYTQYTAAHRRAARGVGTRRRRLHRLGAGEAARAAVQLFRPRYRHGDPAERRPVPVDPRRQCRGAVRGPQAYRRRRQGVRRSPAGPGGAAERFRRQARGDAARRRRGTEGLRRHARRRACGQISPCA